MGVARDVREVLVTEARFLCFLPVRPDLSRLRTHYLVLALAVSWAAGIWRSWDAPTHGWWQYAGYVSIGSLVSTFAMATLLWVIVRPLEPENWSFVNVLTFVGMAAPPTFLYALPMGRFLDSWNAQQATYMLTVFVVEWRLGLLWFFLRGIAQLNWSRALVALLSVLCLVLIVARIPVVLHLEGRRADVRAEEMLLPFGTLALLASPFLLLAYIWVASSYSDSRQTSEKVMPTDPLTGQDEID